MDIGHAIKTVRTKLDLDQKTVAERAGISQSFLSQVERGQREPSFSLVEKIAEACGVPQHLLLLLAAEIPEDKGAFREPLKEISMALLDMIGSLRREEPTT
jgi:transcriptional regulator with XRE-family HTH domain